MSTHTHDNQCDTGNKCLMCVETTPCCPDCDNDDREQRLGHVLLTPETCPCDKRSERLCEVCDGGLAVCTKCGKFEAGLDEPCVRQGGSEGSSDESPDRLAGKDCRTPAIPTFDTDWSQAPRLVRRLITEADAEWFWLKGEQAGRIAEQVETQRWLQQMVEGYSERTQR